MSRGPRIFLALVAAEAVAVATLAVAGAGEAAGRDGRAGGAPRHDRRAGGAPRHDYGALAAELHLTGLALWSEASYCRHPAEADLFTPHAEHPAAPEHFPAGSFVLPPRPDAGGES